MMQQNAYVSRFIACKTDDLFANLEGLSTLRDIVQTERVVDRVSELYHSNAQGMEEYKDLVKLTDKMKTSMVSPPCNSSNNNNNNSGSA